MTQDLYYIESGYLTPDNGYYVYTADAESLVASTASMSCDASVIAGGVIQEGSGNLTIESTVNVTASKFAGASCDMAVTSSVTATISHIHGADLFAFSNAQLAADVAVIRDYNISSSAAFSIAVDAVRGIYVSAQADSIASISIAGSRSRAVEAALDAAFSLTASAGIVEQLASNISSQVTISADASVTKSTLVEISSQVSFSADVSRFRTVEVNASLASSISLTASAKEITRRLLPTVVQGGNYGGMSISSTRSKFGGASLKFDTKPLAFTVPSPTEMLWNGSEFVVLGSKDSSSSLYISKSTDGNTWTSTLTNITLPTSGNTTFHPSNFWYVNSTYILTITNTTPSPDAVLTYSSSDGVTWTLKETINSNVTIIQDLAYSSGLGKYVRVTSGTSESTSYIQSSSDLVTWANASNALNFTLFFALATKGSEIAVVGSFDGAAVIYYDANTSGTFTKVYEDSVDRGTGKQITDIANDGTTWVAVGTGGKILTSTNGTTWTARTSGTTNELRSITKANGLWLAYSNSGQLLSSSDATTWTIVSTGLSSDGVVYGSSKWLSLNSTSSDGSTWSRYDSVYGLPDQAPYVNYPDSDSWTNWKTIDFWFYSETYTSTTTGGVFLTISQGDDLTSAFDSWIIALTSGSIGTNTTGRIYYWIDGTQYSITSPTFNSNQWNHVRISRDNTTSAVYLNGTRIQTATIPTIPASSEPIRIGNLFNQINGVNYLDEVFISDQLKTNPADTSFTVPDAPWANEPDAALLLHFDSNFDDDAGRYPLTQSAQADLVSTSTMAVVTQAIYASASIEAASAQLNVSADYFAGAQANIQASAALSNTTLRIRDGQLSTSSEFTSSSSAVVTRDSVVSLSSQAAVDALAYRTRSNSIQTDAIFSELAAVAKIGDFLITMDYVASVTASISKTVYVGSDMTATSILAADAIKAVDASASASATASQTAVGDRFRSTAVASSSEFAQTSSLNIIHSAASAISSEFALSAESTGTIGLSADINATSQISITNIRVRNAASSISSSSSLSVSVDKFVGSASAMGSNAQVTATVERIQHAVITTESIASQLSAVAKTGRGFITVDVSATLVAGAVKIARNEITANISTQLAAVAVKTVNASSTLAAISSSSIEGTTNITAEAELASAFALTANADLGASGAALVASAGSMTAVVGVIKPLAASMSAQGFELAVGSKTVGFGATIACTSSLTATLGGVFNISANLQGFSAELVAGRVIHIDPALTWIIPVENRVYSIVEEDREYTITEENRLYTITG